MKNVDMAVEQSDRDKETPAAIPGAILLSNGMTKLPNGVILDKDGKP